MIGLARRALAREPPTQLQRQDDDAPPAAFVHRIPHESGDVILAPVLDALREALRRARKDPSTSAPEALNKATPHEDA